MTDNKLPQGHKVRFRARFSVKGVPTDPASVIATVRKPDGSLAVFSRMDGVQRDDVGEYHVDYHCDEAGPMTVRFACELSDQQKDYVVEEPAGTETRADGVSGWKGWSGR